MFPSLYSSEKGDMLAISNKVISEVMRGRVRGSDRGDNKVSSLLGYDISVD
jgi:hypothetical protein